MRTVEHVSMTTSLSPTLLGCLSKPRGRDKKLSDARIDHHRRTQKRKLNSRTRSRKLHIPKPSMPSFEGSPHIFQTLSSSSARMASHRASSSPSAVRGEAIRASHQPKRKSRAISLNHGVKVSSGVRKSIRGQRNDLRVVTATQCGERTRVDKHLLQLLLRDVARVHDFVRVVGVLGVERGEENVVN